MKKSVLFLLALVLGLLSAPNAFASLSEVGTWNGNVGYSSDGFGSLSQSGTISASVPAGSTVLAAYLYTATYSSASENSTDGTMLNGVVVTFNIWVNNPSYPAVSMRRADVTAIVKPVIDAGAGGVYDFTVDEVTSSQDGEALVVVYQNAALDDSTFSLVEGYSDINGDDFSINFAEPIDTTDPNFFAEMFLGISFSCCNQTSTVAINGTTITENAGNRDDGVGSGNNGSLITVGGFDDPFSPFLPSYEEDHERYDISSYITNGDQTIDVFTINPSVNDNILIAGFYVNGLAGVNKPPPPPTTDDVTETVPVPTLSAWGMLVLVALFSFFGYRRRIV